MSNLQEEGEWVMVNITERAAEKVKDVLTQRNREGGFLRIYVSGVGWSGPNFGLTLDGSIQPTDVVNEGFGITIVSDQKNVSYLEDAVIDFKQSWFGRGSFEIRRSNSGGGWGCS